MVSDDSLKDVLDRLRLIATGAAPADRPQIEAAQMLIDFSKAERGMAHYFLAAHHPDTHPNTDPFLPVGGLAPLPANVTTSP